MKIVYLVVFVFLFLVLVSSTSYSYCVGSCNGYEVMCGCELSYESGNYCYYGLDLSKSCYIVVSPYCSGSFNGCWWDCYYEYREEKNCGGCACLLPEEGIVWFNGSAVCTSNGWTCEYEVCSDTCDYIGECCSSCDNTQGCGTYPQNSICKNMYGEEAWCGDDCQCHGYPTCSDTDATDTYPDGDNPYKKGTCTDANGEHNDTCSGNTLTEWYCSGEGSCVNTTYDCSSKWDYWTCNGVKYCWKDGYCDSGRCRATYSSCSCDKDCGAECEAGETKTCPDGTVVSCDTTTCTFPSCPSEIPEGAIRVFVTSKQYRGDLGGLGGADAKCQARLKLQVLEENG